VEELEEQVAQLDSDLSASDQFFRFDPAPPDLPLPDCQGWREQARKAAGD
jgi:hypothetical protein